MTGEEQSDDEISIQEESGTETTEPETESNATVESDPVPATARPNHGASEFLTLPGSESAATITSRSRAANVAARRGLAVKTDRRRSHMMGLPISPRPQDQYIPLTPTVAKPEDSLAVPSQSQT